MKLIDITSDNLDSYKEFERLYDANLSQYLSRIYPDRDNVVKWCYISENGLNTGRVWIEKKDDITVKLGIFIALPEYRHRGLGKKAIKEMTDLAKEKGYQKVTLNVRYNNANARSRYLKSGFRAVRRYTKDNGIDVLEMEYVI